MSKVVLVWSLLCLGLSALPAPRGQPATVIDDGDGPIKLNPTNTGVGSVACTTKDNRVGVCLDYKLCYENGSIIKYGEPDPFEVRQTHRKPNGRCASRTEWCCIDDIPTEGEGQEGGTKPPQPTKPASPGEPGGVVDKLNPDAGDGSGNLTAVARTGLGCGFPTAAASTSSDMALGECPWCVALFRNGGNPKTMNTNGYFCTGSLVHPRVVITAANCVKSAKDTEIMVRVGAYDLSQPPGRYKEQELSVEEAILHHDYNTATKRNNIAFLVLSRPADIQDNVNTACLPRAGDRADRAGACVAAGWGRDKDGRYRDAPAKVSVTPGERADCQSRYRSSGASRGFEVDASSFCAEAAPEADACPANHGSPLTCASEVNKARFVQYGLNSWNLRCGPPGTPGVYLDLAALRPWIDEQMEARAFNTATYTIA